MTTAAQLIGQGIYSIPEVGQIIHAQPRSIRRWINGYEHSRSKIFSTPVLPSKVLKIEGEEVITFQQMIEILFINLFRKYGISMPTIRAAAKQASLDFSTEHPFAIHQLKTDGKSIFSITRSELERYSPDDGDEVTERQLLKDLAMGQYVIARFAEPYFKKIDYGPLEAVRYWPQGNDRSVVIDPARSFGRPIDSKSGVPTKAVYDMYKAGDDIPTISAWYRMEVAAVADAIDFEKSLSYNTPLPA